MADRSVMEFTITIDRPPAAVFEYVADVSKHSEWSPSPFRVEGSTGPLKVGDTFTSIGRLPGDKNHRNDVSVTECSPPDRLVLDCIDHGKHFFNTFTFDAVGSGTKVTRTVDAPKPTFPLSLVFPVIKAAFINPEVNKGLGMLKANLERS